MAAARVLLGGLGSPEGLPGVPLPVVLHVPQVPVVLPVRWEGLPEGPAARGARVVPVRVLPGVDAFGVEGVLAGEEPGFAPQPEQVFQAHDALFVALVGPGWLGRARSYKLNLCLGS